MMPVLRTDATSVARAAPRPSGRARGKSRDRGVRGHDRQTMDEVGSFSYFKDPEGNVFGAMQPA